MVVFLTTENDDDATKSLGLELGENPEIVLIGHSFGGLTIMKWLEQRYYEDERNRSNIAGMQQRERGIADVGDKMLVLAEIQLQLDALFAGLYRFDPH